MSSAKLTKPTMTYSANNLYLRRQMTLLLVLWLLGIIQVCSFVPTVRRGAIDERLWSTRLRAGLSTETLTFHTGDYSHSSDPLPTTREEAADFLRLEEARNLVVSAGGKRPIKVEEPTPNLKELWTQACERFYGPLYYYEDGDMVIAAESIINFPGLQLVTTTCNGWKYSEEDGMPVHEFMSIAEKREARGPGPLVWLFNQLTGADKKDSGDYIASAAFAKSKIMVDEKEGECVYNFGLELKIFVEFPRALVRILPTSKEKMEEQGSAAVLKAVQKDVIESMVAVREALIKHTEGAKASPVPRG